MWTLRWISLNHLSGEKNAPPWILTTEITSPRRSRRARTSFRFGALNDFTSLVRLSRAAYRPGTFSQDNIRKVREQSEQSEKPRTAMLRIDPSSSRAGHIYSIQTFNSKEQAKELLHKHVAQVWGTNKEMPFLDVFMDLSTFSGPRAQVHLQPAVSERNRGARSLDL